LWRQGAQIPRPDKQVTFFSNVHNTPRRNPHSRNGHLVSDTYEPGSFPIHRIKGPTAFTHKPRNDGHTPALINDLSLDTLNA